MKNRLERRYGWGHLHFIACSCYRRLAAVAFRRRAKNIFAKILGEVRDRYGFALVGYVVMPEHIHLPISEAVRGTPPPSFRCSSSASRVACAARSERSAGQLRLS